MSDLTLSPPWPIVGAYFRPPAKALLEVLPAGTLLLLRSEPTNPVDPNAIQVWLEREALNVVLTNENVRAVLEENLPLFGFDLSEVQMAEAHHLGFLPNFRKRLRCAETIVLPQGDARAVLVFDAAGQALVSPALAEGADWQIAEGSNANVGDSL